MREVFDGYFVTECGKVWSEKTKRFLKLRPLPSGYLKVSVGYPQKDHYIHRLVATAYIANPKNKKEVNHKNGDKTDNRVSNLEWATHSENQLHKTRVLGISSGEKDVKAKMTNKEVALIKKRISLGERPTHLAKEYGVTRKAICSIKHGRSWVTVEEGV